MPELMVREGQVGVENVELIIDVPHLKVWVVSLARENAGILTASHREVFLQAPLGSGNTTILDTGLDEKWDLIADVHRTTCRVVAYRHPDPAPPWAEHYRADNELGEAVPDPGPEQLTALVAGLNNTDNRFLMLSPVAEGQSWGAMVKPRRRGERWDIELRQRAGTALTKHSATSVDATVLHLSVWLATVIFPDQAGGFTPTAVKPHWPLYTAIYTGC
ncbi:MAG: hypothetical protein ABWY93_07950 [Mycobacterium sp.]